MGLTKSVGGLRAVIEVGVHAIHTMWESLKEKEEMDFLPTDARNAFNKGNQTQMLWAVWHLWPTGYASLSTATDII